MAVVKVSGGANAGKYAATNKDGVKQYFSSQSAAVSYSRTGGSTTSKTSSTSSGSSTTSTLTREQQLAEMMKTAQSISAGIQSSAAGFTDAERAKLGAGLTQAQAGLDKYTSTQPKAVQDRVALAKASAPTNVANITQLNPAVVPPTQPTEVNPINALSVSSGMQAFLDAYRIQMEQAQARADKLAKDNQSLTDKYLGTMKNPEDVYEQAWKDTGMSAKEYFASQEKGIKEIETLNNEYANVKGAMEQQIAQSNDKMASMNFINNQTAQIRRNAEPQLNTISANISSKAATLQAQQGNFAEARSLVKDAVDAATAGNKFKYDMYKAYYDQNIDNFNRVDSVYKDAFEGAMNIAFKDYEMQREEKMQIGELMLKYPNAGITMNDSLAEAFDRAGLVAPTDTTEMTADMRNYYLAKSDPEFAKFLGNASDSDLTTLESYAEGLLNGDMEITNIPEKYRAAAYALSNKKAQELLNAQNTPAAPTPATISAPTGNYSKSPGSGTTLTSIYNSIADALWRD